MEPVKELAVAARLCPRGRRITPSVPLNGTPVSSRATPAGPAAGTLSLRDLFVIFLRAGLAFGGGLGIMAALEEELVHKRGVVSRTDYLATYSLARFVPSGTMTAMAVAYGHRFGGWIGSAVAMAALVLPSTVLTILLTMAYGALRGGPTLELLAVRVAKAGDQVVILLSGHGAQQSEKNPPPDPRFAEADGLDEIFLPADIGAWDGGAQTVANAIVDDEIRDWTTRLVEKQASVWLIADCCHSCTLLRGTDDEVVREIQPEDLKIPDNAIRQAQQRAAEREPARGAEQTRGAAEEAPFKLAEAPGHLVAIYAAQSHEVTVEKSLPVGSADAKPHGLLTYTLCQILSKPDPEPLTYRELVRRIHEQYQGMGRNFPTPLVEGKDRDREVLGLKEWPGRSRFLLEKDGRGTWTLNAGALHGLTVRSILAVYPPAGQPGGDKPVGHVRITAARSLDAVVEPCAYDSVPVNHHLPRRGRCELVYIDYGDLRLKIALDTVAEGKQRGLTAAPAKLAEQMRRLTGRGSIAEMVQDPKNADWLVRSMGDKVFLLPAQGVAVRGRPNAKAAALLVPDAHTVSENLVFGPYPADQAAKELQDRLGRIARVEMLKHLAISPAGEIVRGGSKIDLGIELIRFKDKADQKGQAVAWRSNGIRLYKGDLVAFRVTNRSRNVRVFVTLLFVNSRYGIESLYPGEGEITGRLEPGKSFRTDKLKVATDTSGLEHVVAIAIKATGGPVDFTALCQPTIERARAVSATRGEGDALKSPLGQLFQNALYAQGTTRGFDRVDLQDFALRLFSWQTMPDPPARIDK